MLIKGVVNAKALGNTGVKVFFDSHSLISAHGLFLLTDNESQITEEYPSGHKGADL